MRDDEEYQRELDLKEHQRTRDHVLFVGWHNPELFAVSRAKSLLFYAPVPVSENEIESSCLLRVSSLSCLT